MSTVVVGCKTPTGLILTVGDVAVRLNGWNDNVIAGADHGLTSDVSKDFWDAWAKTDQGKMMIDAGILFAHEKEANTKAQAKDLAGQQAANVPLKPTEILEAKTA
jgi:hypothetical protein